MVVPFIFLNWDVVDAFLVFFSYQSSFFIHRGDFFYIFM